MKIDIKWLTLLFIAVFSMGAMTGGFATCWNLADKKVALCINPGSLDSRWSTADRKIALCVTRDSLNHCWIGADRKIAVATIGNQEVKDDLFVAVMSALNASGSLNLYKLRMN